MQDSERNDPVVARLLAAPAATVDTERALARVRARAARPSLRRVPLRWAQGLAAAAAVVVVASALTISGFADSIFTIFEPQHFVAVPIGAGDLRSSGGLAQYGTLALSGTPNPVPVADRAAAAAAVGFTPLVPGAPPAGLGAATWSVLKETGATFTFSAAAARDAAARAGRTAPPVPANLDGSRIVVSVGAAVVQLWPSGTGGGLPGTLGSSLPAAAPGGLPGFAVVQLRAPTVSSDGATIAELQALLLAQPGVSPELASQIRAIADPAHTLPVPVPAGQVSTRQVRVQGTDGLFVGDSSGLGSAVVWRKGEFVFAAAGTLSSSQLLAAADSLR